MLTLAYSNRRRRAELTDLLVKLVKILLTGLLVTTATSKTDRQAAPPSSSPSATTSV
ncbi:hypothetical protein [Streptomyces pseudogriseolus]|uniref:hypothetical protein n=1 Tax=Streptomyces pseudogriseolus TaxID=36817 RepID=UPI003FA20F35